MLQQAWLNSRSLILVSRPTQGRAADMAIGSRGAKRPSFSSRFALSWKRGRREDRVHAAPAVSCATCTEKVRARAYRFGGGIRPSLRDGLRLIRARPGETLLLCHHHPRSAFASHGLTTSVGAAGPHDFTVRLACTRLCALGVHRIFTHVRDVRETPLVSGETARIRPLIWGVSQVLFVKSEVNF